MSVQNFPMYSFRHSDYHPWLLPQPLSDTFLQHASKASLTHWLCYQIYFDKLRTLYLHTESNQNIQRWKYPQSAHYQSMKIYYPETRTIVYGYLFRVLNHIMQNSPFYIHQALLKYNRSR